MLQARSADVLARFCTQLKPFQTTTQQAPEPAPNGAPAPAPIASIADYVNCTFLSFDPSFEALIGSNRTVYQVGPSKPGSFWACESPTYLPGVRRFCGPGGLHILRTVQSLGVAGRLCSQSWHARRLGSWIKFCAVTLWLLSVNLACDSSRYIWKVLVYKLLGW